MGTDLYDVLGLTKDCSQQEIKKAYRKLALKYHPDKNGGDEVASDKFKEVTEAYSVLSDEEKRSNYDRYGSVDGSRAKGFPEGFSDIFEDFFPGFGGFSGNRGTREVKGTDVFLDVSISPLDSLNGSEKKIKFEKSQKCNKCEGAGYNSDADLSVCPSCNGQGKQTQKMGFMNFTVSCNACSGQGAIIKNPCSKCSGMGLKSNHSEISVTIPRGVHSGSKLRLQSMGNFEPGSNVPGDLYLTIFIDTKGKFEIKGADVYSKCTIDYVDAVLGSQIKVETIDGNKSVKIPPGTCAGQKLKLKESGLPISVGNYQRGDTVVEIDISVPKSLAKDERELLVKLRDLRKNSSKKFF